MTRRKVSVLLILAMLLNLSSLGAATASDISGQDLAAAMRFRSEFGLTTDLAHVRAAASRVDVSWDWGVPLAPEEDQELRRRDAIAQQMGPLNRRALELPELGAVWFDQQAGGEIVVAMAGDPESYRAEIAKLVPHGANFRMESVRYPLRQLLDVHDTIIDEYLELAEAGINVTAVIVDESGNRVEVGVDGDPQAAAAYLGDRYAISIDTFVSGGGAYTACTSRTTFDAPPLRGGISTTTPGSATPQCSVAFIVNQAGKQRLLTAGHSPCGIAGNYTHDGNAIGSMKTRSWFGEAQEHADAATIGDLTDTQDSRWLMMSCATCYMTMLGHQASDNEGISVCLSARITQSIRCGQMINKNASICWTGVGCLVAQREATYAIYSGDSGGAAFSQSGYAYGVQSSCVDRSGNGGCEFGDTVDNALYSHITHVFSELGGTMSIYTGG